MFSSTFERVQDLTDITLRLIGKDIQCVSAIATQRDFAYALSKVLAVPVRVEEVSMDQYLQVGQHLKGVKPGHPFNENFTLETLWKTCGFWYEDPARRGDPEESLRIIEADGFKAKTLEDVLRIGGGWKFVQD